MVECKEISFRRWIMGNLFNMDNAFFSFISKVCDIMILSTVWILLCIPIITIGPASTALYYAVVKVVRRERGYLLREFFRSFKMNFKRGTAANRAPQRRRNDLRLLHPQ